MIKRRHNQKYLVDKIPKKPIYSLASSETEILSPHTSSPETEALPEQFVQLHYATSDRTPEESEKDKYQATPAGLFMQYLAGKLKITPLNLLLIGGIAWIVILVWTYLQDNGSGKLDTQQGLNWFLIKIQYVNKFFGLLLLIIFLYWGIDSIIKRSRRNRQHK